MIFKLILLLIILITPLLVPFWGFGYENIKVLGFIILVTLAALISLWSKTQFTWSKHNLLSLVFLFGLSLSSLQGVDPLNSLMGTAPYYQGLILYLYLFLFSLLVGSTKVPLRWWVSISSLASLIVSLLAIKDYLLLEMLHQDVPLYAGRVVSTFGQPNFYAGFILLALSQVTHLLNSGNKAIRVFGYLHLVLGSLAIVVSDSKATIGLLLIFLLGWLIFRMPKIFGVGLGFVMGAILASYFWINLPTQLWDGEWLGHNAPEKRLIFTPTLLKIAENSLLLGYGLENIDPVYQQYFQGIDFNTLNDPLPHTLKNLQIDRSHSYLLDLMLFSGIVGVGVYLVLVLTLVLRVRSQSLLTGLSIYLIWTQFHNQSIVHLIYFWWMVGLISKADIDKG